MSGKITELIANMEATDCCSLYELSGFTQSVVDHRQLMGEEAQYEASGFRESQWPPHPQVGAAAIATTTASQKKTAKTLKRLGFTKVGKWKSSSTGSVITLWAWFPVFKEKKRGRKKR